MGLRIQSLIQWVKDLALLWLWHRLAATPIQPIAWEPPYATGTALKDKKKKKKKKKKERKKAGTVILIDKVDIRKHIITK